MLNIGTKVDNQPNQAEGTLTAAEFNSLTTELKNIITSSGQTLSGGDTFQLAESIAIYSLSAAYYIDSGTANTYTLTLPGSKKGPNAYVDGMRIRFYAANTNTGASTANAASLGSKPIKLLDGSDLVAGNITAGGSIELVYRVSLDAWVLSQYVAITGAQTIFDKKVFNTVPGSNTDPSVGTDLVRKSFFDSQVAALSINNYPPNYRSSASPVYVNSSSFSVASIQLRDFANAGNITKQTSTTVSFSTTGLNGIAVSTNLTGTVTVASGNNTVTFSTSQTGVVQIGDVITTAGGNARRLTGGSGTSWTVNTNWSANETTVTCKRGGLALNTFYYLYGIAQAGGANPGYILSTRNVNKGDTLVDLPGSYTLSMQEPSGFRTMADSSLLPFRVVDNSGSTIKIMMDVDHTQSPWQVLSTNSTGSFSTIDCSQIAPANAISGDFAGNAIHNSTAGYDLAYMRPGGVTAASRVIAYTGAPNNSPTACAISVFDMPFSSTQTVDFKSGAGSNCPSVTLGLIGYTLAVK